VLSAVDRKIEQYILSLEHAEILRLYRLLPSGKRLRAKLITYIAGDTIEAIKLAAIVELIHAASLLHDDVIDDSLVRRGKESINAIFGNKTAIMLGDTLYSKSFNELSKMDSRIAEIISNAVIKLSIGELDDVDISKSFSIDREKYLDMIYGKTASLMEASASVAALLAGKSYQKYAIYGKNLGLAFQMIDDLLDITAGSDTLGKPALHDFKEGKTTLPYIYLYECMDEIDKSRLKNMHKKTLSPAESDWVISQMHKHNIPAICYNEAKDLIEEAMKLMKEEGEEKLYMIANEMINREY